MTNHHQNYVRLVLDVISHKAVPFVSNTQVTIAFQASYGCNTHSLCNVASIQCEIDAQHYHSVK